MYLVSRRVLSLPDLSKNFKWTFLIKKFSISTNSAKVDIIYKDIDKSKYESLVYKFADVEMQESVRLEIDCILNHYDYLKYLNGHAPSDLSSEQMCDLINTTGQVAREKYIRYLFLTEVRKLKDQMRKEKRKMENKHFIGSRSNRCFGIFDGNGNLSYQLWGNSLITRISARNVSNFRTESKLRNSCLFGQNLVLDVDYEDHMSVSECRIQARHIMSTLTENLSTIEPFNIYITNCDYNRPTMKHLSKFFHFSPFERMDLNHHIRRESYLDIFPKERLVYLSPHAPECLESYSHDDIYIIGAFLDKRCLNKPVSHLKARSAGIRQYRLPLDKYVLWGPGSSKNLCIMHVVAILNSMKICNDWQSSISINVPKRKMKNADVALTEEQRKRILFLKRKLQIEQYKCQLNNVN